MYAIVDIETTGSFAAANGITEIAVVIHDGNKIVDSYETLINPQQPVPYFIQSMTGITNEMVENAPLFDEVAEKIYDLLHDKIFVAHNVNFDFSFVKHQLKDCGYELKSKKLCTVRLSKKIMPGYQSYSLGRLCHQLGIGNNARHRAMGDAYATAEIFDMLLKKEIAAEVIAEMLKSNSKEQSLPPNLPRKQFEALPDMPGVYYFHDEKGKVIYTGKAKNLKKRVSSHFANNSTGKQKQNFLQHIYSLSFEPCGTELMAIILESTEIKRLWPEFNRSQKSFEPAFAIYDYEDANGFVRMGIDKPRKNTEALATFRISAEATNLLWKIADEFELCPKKCGLQDSNSICMRASTISCECETDDAATHNIRMNNAIEFLQQLKPTYAIIDKGRKPHEQSCVLMERGKFYGMGYIQHDFKINDVEELKSYLTPMKENFYIRYMMEQHKAEFPNKVLKLDALVKLSAD